MSEAVKTLIFVAVAAVTGVLAYVSHPAPATSSPEEEVNQSLFPEFIDPLQAQSMEIVRYDADRGQILRFEVAETDDGWVIVSKGGYPANATEHITNAANSLVDLKVLRVVSDLPKQHAEFGVVEPTDTVATSGDEGVGELVTIKGESDKMLANLIVGAADKDDPKLRYVRLPGRDRIYLVKLDPTVFSTNFSDWIESNLFEINPFDVGSLRFFNYNIQVVQRQIQVLPQMDATVGYDNEKNAWQLFGLKEPPANGATTLVDAKLPTGAVLNREKLDEIRNALRDVTIVDVNRKPDALADALRAGKGLEDLERDDYLTLFSNGFYPNVMPGETKPRLVGLNSELVIETIDAVRYRILFGITKLGGENKNENHQFIFVQTELVNEMIPPPTLQEVPKIKEGEGQDVEAQAVARENIMKQNDALMAAYHEKRNTALRKIFTLNERFADWYYVVKADDAAKIRLKRDQLVLGGQAPGAMPGGMGMFRLPTEQPGPAQPPATQPKPDESKPVEAKPEDTKPAESDMPEVKPEETKPAAEEPASESKPEEKPAEVKEPASEDASSPQEEPMKPDEKPATSEDSES
ncbi:DUF4340 domain-containing protein [bacterium]|nr:DUF4340 domain-containing protein [bacterium]